MITGSDFYPDEELTSHFLVKHKGFSSICKWWIQCSSNSIHNKHFMHSSKHWQQNYWLIKGLQRWQTCIDRMTQSAVLCMLSQMSLHWPAGETKPLYRLWCHARELQMIWQHCVENMSPFNRWWRVIVTVSSISHRIHAEFLFLATYKDTVA